MTANTEYNELLVMKLVIAIVPLLFALPASGQRHIQGPDCKGVVYGAVLGQNDEPVNGFDVTLYPLDSLRGQSLCYRPSAQPFLKRSLPSEVIDERA
jgi:hypothetical protein